MTAGPAPTADRLLSYLNGARWFGGKGRRFDIAGTTALPWLSAPGSWPAVRIEIVEIRYLDDDANGEPEFYQLPISYRQLPAPGLAGAEIGRFAVPGLGTVTGYDAPQDQQACRTLLARLLAGDELATDRAAVTFKVLDSEPLTGTEQARVFGGQQSNTSILFGESGMLKLFRRLELGRNLDIEVLLRLNKEPDLEVTALYGWIEATWLRCGAAVSSDLGMLVEQLREARDGWELALAKLSSGQDFSSDAEALGRALADVHRGLAAQFPTRTTPGRRVAEVMRRRLTSAVAVAPALAPQVEALRRCFDLLADSELPVQRLHGDFHLGQTLATPGGWKIIDFEGEPVKTLAERAEPDSVWRDVAGMLRSFGYAAASVAGPAGKVWATGCRQAFLRGYCGAPSGADNAVLRAYEADKAVYEVVYEVRNRPEWAHIPLTAIADLTREGH